MRLLTAGSLVRAQQGEPKEPDRSIVLSGSFYFLLLYTRTNIPVLNSRAAVRRCAAAIIAQDLLSAKKHSSTRPDLISILGFPAAKLGVSGAVSDRDDLASRRKVVGLSWAAGAKKSVHIRVRIFTFFLFIIHSSLKFVNSGKLTK